MKKLLLLSMTILFFALVSCDAFLPDYTENMTPLDPPIQVAIGNNDVWFSFEYEMNDNQILYYAPKTLHIDDQVYLNKTTNYYIYTIKPSIFQLDQYNIATSDQLKEIFS